MINTREDLNRLKDEYSKLFSSLKMRILICGGTGCVANGSMKLYQRFEELLREKEIFVDLEFVKEEHDG